MACRLPGGVDTPDALWEALLAERDLVSEVPPERFPIDAHFDAERGAAGRSYSRWGGFLGDLHGFDAGFFGISAREAQTLDPQARLLLETTWEAAERAGQTRAALRGSDTGVFLGICGSEYGVAATRELERIDHHTLTGTSPSAHAGRIAYWLGLTGPCFPVDTACSSSLLSVHLAVQALRAGECAQAFAGGVNLILSPTGHVYFSRLGALSPTGRCRTFSADADGYVRAEGCGVVFLKRLADAERDGDPVVALIRGSAVNQDGRSNGLTAPSGPAQQAVIRRALAQAGLEPSSVGYVECHGTGTPLGDPIEVGALAAVYGEGRAASAPLRLGSLKSNLGHAEGAAGVAGLIKLALMLERGHVPRSLHVDPGALNPAVPWTSLPLQVAAQAEPWPAHALPRRGAVSAFAFQGTNVHLVLEEGPRRAAPAVPAAPPPVLPLVLSAHREDALRAQADRLAAWVAEHRPAPLDLLATLATRRSDLRVRRAHAVPSDDVDALVRALRAIAAGEGPQGAAGPRPRGGLAFLFTGQGSQRLGMGRALHRAFPAFARAFDAVCAAFTPHLPEPLAETMWGDDAIRLARTRWTQPALFALEVALYRLWESVGVVPDLLIGHSVGELSAAHVAGVLSLDDACRLVAARGEAMEAAPSGGAMAALSLPADELGARLARTPGVELAAVNGPRACVVTGPPAAVAELLRELEAEGVRARLLEVSHAFHSAAMEPAARRVAALAAELELHPPRLPVVSTLDPTLDDAALSEPSYWGRQLRQPVRFAAALRAAADAGVRLLVELGPRAVLAPLARRTLDASEAPLILSTLDARRAELEAACGAFASCHLRGRALDWRSLFAELQPRRLEAALPSYPFQREPHWLPEPPTPRGASRHAPGANPARPASTPPPLPALPNAAGAGTRTTPTPSSGKLRLRPPAACGPRLRGPSAPPPRKAASGQPPPMRAGMHPTPTQSSSGGEGTDRSELADAAARAPVPVPAVPAPVPQPIRSAPRAEARPAFDPSAERLGLYRLQRRRLDTLCLQEREAGRREPAFLHELHAAEALLERAAAAADRPATPHGPPRQTRRHPEAPGAPRSHPPAEPRRRVRFPAEHPALRDHQLDGRARLAIDQQLELLASSARAGAKAAVTLRDLHLRHPLDADSDGALEVEARSTDATDGQRVQLFDATGRLAAEADVTPGAPSLGIRIPLDPPGPAGRAGPALYAAAAAAGATFGPAYRALAALHDEGERSVVRLVAAPAAAELGGSLPLALLNGLVFAALSVAAEASGSRVLPAGVALAELAPNRLERGVGQLHWIERGADGALLDADLLAEDGTLVARLEGLRLAAVAPLPSSQAVPNIAARPREAPRSGPRPPTGPRASAGAGTLLAVRRQVAAALLQADPVDPDTPFDELGLDSVVAAELVRDLGRELEVPLAVADVYEFPSARFLASRIDARRAQAAHEAQRLEAAAAEAEALARALGPATRSRRVEVEGQRLELFEAGDGPELVLLLPGACSPAVWRHQLRDPPPGRRLLTLSWPGGGRSPAGPTEARALARLCAALLEALGLETPHLVGFSFGGLVALELARAGHARSLTLVSSRAHVAPGDVDPRELARDFARDLARRPDAPGLDFELLRGPPLLLEQAFDLRPTLGAIHVPTRVLVGEHDAICPPACARELATGIPGARLELVAEVGHTLPLFEPASVEAALREQLGATTHHDSQVRA